VIPLLLLEDRGLPRTDAAAAASLSAFFCARNSFPESGPPLRASSSSITAF
jgi:hypothetical protein